MMQVSTESHFDKNINIVVMIKHGCTVSWPKILFKKKKKNTESAEEKGFFFQNKKVDWLWILIMNTIYTSDVGDATNFIIWNL